MTMLTEVQFTEARNQLSTLYDRVFNAFNPVIIKRKQSEEIALLRVDLLKMLLAEYDLRPEVIPEADGSVTLALDRLELYTNGDTAEKALADLVEDLKLYARDYIMRPQLFLQAPNRKGHFPYILRVLLCEDDAEIRQLLELKDAS